MNNELDNWIKKNNFSNKKLKFYVDCMQYAFNESVEANDKDRDKMHEQISIFKKYLKKEVKNDIQYLL